MVNIDGFSIAAAGVEFGVGWHTAHTAVADYTEQTVSSNGFLAMWPAGTGYPGNSSINWFAANLTLANGGVASLGTSVNAGPGSATVVFLGVPAARTQFIIDVTGYYL